MCYVLCATLLQYVSAHGLFEAMRGIAEPLMRGMFETLRGMPEAMRRMREAIMCGMFETLRGMPEAMRRMREAIMCGMFETMRGIVGGAHDGQRFFLEVCYLLLLLLFQ